MLVGLKSGGVTSNHNDANFSDPYVHSHSSVGKIDPTPKFKWQTTPCITWYFHSLSRILVKLCF